MEDLHLTEDRGPRNRSLGLLAVVALFCAVPSVSAGDEAAMVLARVQTWLDGTKDLQAGFAQTLVSGALGAGGHLDRGRFRSAADDASGSVVAAPTATPRPLGGDPASPRRPAGPLLRRLPLLSFPSG